MGKKPIINTHCHLLNLDFIPKDSVKQLSYVSKKSFKSWVDKIGFLAKLNPGASYRYLKDSIKTYKLPIQEVTKKYIKELDEAEINICVPLMMDLSQAVNQKILNERELTNYTGQITLISEMINKYPFRILIVVVFPVPRGPEKI